MTRRLTTLLTCAALFAVALGGCGDKAPGLPRSDAAELVQLLKTARAAAGNAQRCDTLLATIRDLEAKVASLPSDVDRDVRESLANGVKNLAVSAEAQCANTQTTPTTPTVPTVPTTPTPTQTIPTTPQTTPTVPTTPTPTTTTPTPTTTIPGNGGTGGTGPGGGGEGGGGSNGSGSGNSGGGGA